MLTSSRFQQLDNALKDKDSAVQALTQDMANNKERSLLELGGVVTFDLPMLTFDLPRLTFDLPKRSVLQKEANLGRSKVTTFHGTW